MRSLYAEYMKERAGIETIEHDYGFISFSITPSKEFYIRDLFVKPEFREKHYASKLGNEAIATAKSLGFSEIWGTVDLSTRGAANSMMVLCGFGFNPVSAGQNVISFVKRI